MWNASRFCVSSLRRGHANLLCIESNLLDMLPEQAQPNTVTAYLITPCCQGDCRQRGAASGHHSIAGTTSGILKHNK